MNITFQLKHALQYFYYSLLCTGKNHRMITSYMFFFKQTKLKDLLISICMSNSFIN